MDDLLTTYSEAIERLFARTTSGTKFGLERTQALLARLDSPQDRFPAVHIAGTNGKGSVVATSEALLHATGLRVGRYTSPHLVDFRERITVDSVPISERAVLDFLEEWIPAAEELGATFFELTTALAFYWFAKQHVDIAVIETGLGGRLDSTNVITPLVATVTSIGLDHTDLLGDTLEKIAREKAGIFKSGVPAVIGESQPSIRALLEKCARDVGAEPVITLDANYDVRDIEVSAKGTSFTLDDQRSSQTLTTPLIGEHQARNTAMALATVRALGARYVPASSAITDALSRVFLPGRFQRSGKFIFDVAHNPDGAHTVAATMSSVSTPAPRVALLAVLADKDWRGIILALAKAVDQFIFTNAPSAPRDRQWRPEDASAFATSLGLQNTLEPDIDRALTLATENARTVLVTGSFHTVGDVMSRLQVSPFAA